MSHIQRLFFVFFFLEPPPLLPTLCKTDYTKAASDCSMGETICVTPPVCKFSPYLQPITVSLSVTSSIINNLAFILTRVRKRPAVHGVRTARWGCYLAIRTRWPTGSAICVQFLILFYFFYPLTQKKKLISGGVAKPVNEPGR